MSESKLAHSQSDAQSGGQLSDHRSHAEQNRATASPSSSEEVGELGLPFPENHSPLPIFANLVRFFEGLGSIKGEGSQNRRRRFITGFINSWRKAVGNDIYPVVQLWFPSEDEQLKQLGQIKEQQIGRMLVEALNLPPKSPDAIALSQPRRIGGRGISSSSSNIDDSLASRVRQAVKLRYSKPDYSRWRINEVASKLIKFTESKKADRISILKEMIEAMNSEEIYWIVKIMLRNLALNCSEKSFLNVFHENAVQVYMVNKNMKTVCQQLWSPQFSVSEADKCVHLMSYFCPMRAKFVKGAAEDMKSIVELMRAPGSDEDPFFFIEEKVDGDRVQLHWKRDGNATKFLSRRGTDYTNSYSGMFGNQDSLKEDHSLSQSEDSVTLSDFVAEEVYECILDGEIVAWDPETNDVCGQSKVKELITHQKGGRYRHMMFVFDVVFVNGEALTDLELADRKERLEEILPVDKRRLAIGKIQVLPYVLGSTAEDIAREFKKVVGEMSEGLVVKDLHSKYELDGKTNSWTKVKPEFVDGYQGEHMDLIVVGCSRGTGRLRNIFASYLCALVDEKQEGRFVAFTRIGSGICLAMYSYINSLIEENRFAQKEPPEWLVLGNERPPDFYIEPAKSVVLEVKYSEISSVVAESARTASTRYGVGYSLRFPRYVKLRDDKDVNSAMTIGELLSLHLSRGQRARAMMEKQAQKRKSHDNKSSIAKRIKSLVNNNEIEVKQDFLKSQKFLVCGDIESPNFLSKREFERFIRENGGYVSEKTGPDVITLSDRKVPKAMELMLTGNMILYPKYVFDCVDSGRLLAPEPSHFFSGSVPVTHPDLALVDKFGFSLYRTQSYLDVEQLFNKIDVSTLEIDPQTIKEAQEYISNPPNADESNQPKLHVHLFYGLQVYVDPNLLMGFAVRSMLRFGSAELTSSVENADYVVKDLPDSTNSKEVSVQWVIDQWNST